MPSNLLTPQKRHCWAFLARALGAMTPVSAIGQMWHFTTGGVARVAAPNLQLVSNCHSSATIYFTPLS
jgi:hypothetical protein